MPLMIIIFKNRLFEVFTASSYIKDGQFVVHCWANFDTWLGNKKFSRLFEHQYHRFFQYPNIGIDD